MVSFIFIVTADEKMTEFLIFEWHEISSTCAAMIPTWGVGGTAAEL